MSTIKEFMDALTDATINGIVISFWFICLVGLWKWFLGVVKKVLLNLFPGLKGLSKNGKEDTEDLEVKKEKR